VENGGLTNSRGVLLIHGAHEGNMTSFLRGGEIERCIAVAQAAEVTRFGQSGASRQPLILCSHLQPEASNAKSYIKGYLRRASAPRLNESI
jgi:hypothetical protein